MLDHVNQDKIDSNGNDRKNLQFYKTMKGTFSPEPHLLNLPKRSQRVWLTRFCMRAVSQLRVEEGRHTQPFTPLEHRKCVYCDSNTLEDEMHAILLFL